MTLEKVCSDTEIFLAIYILRVTCQTYCKIMYLCPWRLFLSKQTVQILIIIWHLIWVFKLFAKVLVYRYQKWEGLTLCLLVSSADSLCKQFGPWSNLTSGLIWIQTVYHSDGIPEIFWKKSADHKKACLKNYSEGSLYVWVRAVCCFLSILQITDVWLKVIIKD